MTIQECYQRLGGDYAQMEKRLPSVHLLERFITKFLEDPSFSDLCCAVQAGQREQAFMAAHTLKGVSANLGFSKLTDAASRMTELLRPEASAIPEGVAALLEEVRQSYELTTGAICAYLGSTAP